MIIRRYFSAFILFVPIWAFAQLCEPDYEVPLMMTVGSVNGEMTDPIQTNAVGSAMMTFGQSMVLNSSTDNSSYSMAQGFWSYYLTEPLPPVLWASDGDYLGMIQLDWDMEDDLTGPPVTSDDATIYRDDHIIATVPIDQTEYMDNAVFAGENYSYRIEVSNDFGDSQNGNNGGFLDVNGSITGQILTASGNPVEGAKVTLGPNMGQYAEFDGNDDYIYWFNDWTEENAQFTGFENDYTIETWFRSVSSSSGTAQTIFAAVVSGQTTPEILIQLTSDGYMEYTHSDSTSSTTIRSIDSYVEAGAPWRHLVVAYSENYMKMYIDGQKIVEDEAAPGYIGAQSDYYDPESGGHVTGGLEMIIGKLGPTEHEQYFHGYLDDFRIWSREIEWEEVLHNSEMTLGGDEDNLAGYWKFDEADGEELFDLSLDSLGNENNLDAFVCGVERMQTNPSPVYVGGETDSLGNYTIRGIYYGTGTTFTATPSQVTVMGRSLHNNFNTHHQTMYVSFDNERIDLTDDFTIGGWFKTTDETTGKKTLFQAQNSSDGSDDLLVSLDGGQLSFEYLSNTPITTTGGSLIDNTWHHWAVSFGAGALTAYVMGDYEGEISVGNDTISELSKLFIGGEYNSVQDTMVNHFIGNLDDILVWNSARSDDQISADMITIHDGTESGLSHYWNFNEGSDNVINDVAGGSVTGEIEGVPPERYSRAWSINIPLNEVYEHYYDPESRQATLNNSNTSVDLVDFLDNSAIAVSGYVLYESTFCVVEGVEILLNGESDSPPVYTDADGHYIIDMEPGESGIWITASYDGHTFSSLSGIELPTISGPLSGQNFYDTTVRSVSGIVAGGYCKIPLGDQGTSITLESTDSLSCFSMEYEVDIVDGTWSSGDIPPLVYDIYLTSNNSLIEDAFYASVIYLEDSSKTKDFIYRAPLQVAFDTGSIRDHDDDDGISNDTSSYDSLDSLLFDADLVLKQGYSYSVDFDVFEEYDGVRCDVDTFDVVFNNNVTGGAGFETSIAIDSADTLLP